MLDAIEQLISNEKKYQEEIETLKIMLKEHRKVIENLEDENMRLQSIIDQVV